MSCNVLSLKSRFSFYRVCVLKPLLSGVWGTGLRYKRSPEFFLTLCLSLACAVAAHSGRVMHLLWHVLVFSCLACSTEEALGPWAPGCCFGPKERLTVSGHLFFCVSGTGKAKPLLPTVPPTSCVVCSCSLAPCPRPVGWDSHYCIKG